MNEISFFCEALVDQDRKVGLDPVGYYCSARAVYRLPDGHLLCGRCAVLLDHCPERISFGPGPFGEEYQRNTFGKLLAELCDALGIGFRPR